MSQNGLDSVLVSWTAPLGGPAVTGYIIYYQQQQGGQRFSESAGATATNTIITGLITGVTYFITMLATSSILPSTETSALNVTIGRGQPLIQRYNIIIIVTSAVKDNDAQYKG